MIEPRSNRPGRRARRVTAVAAAMAGVAGARALVGGPVAASAATDVQLRVAHFSPDTPPMDVYATGFDGKEQLVLPKLGYGGVSEYLPLTAGVYAFSMRPAPAATALALAGGVAAPGAWGVRRSRPRRRQPVDCLDRR